MPSDVNVLYQIACGVAYIYSKKLVHRDIKPENILISLTDPVMMKISDFGLSKSVNSRGSFSDSGIKGTHNWMAPELLAKANSSDEVEIAQRASVKSDIFSTGCVFFYFVTRGTHPFGGNFFIMINILQNKPVNFIGKKIQFIEHTKDFSNKERTCKLQLEYLKLGKWNNFNGYKLSTGFLCVINSSCTEGVRNSPYKLKCRFHFNIVLQS